MTSNSLWWRKIPSDCNGFALGLSGLTATFVKLSGVTNSRGLEIFLLLAALFSVSLSLSLQILYFSRAFKVPTTTLQLARESLVEFSHHTWPVTLASITAAFFNILNGLGATGSEGVGVARGFVYFFGVVHFVLGSLFLGQAVKLKAK
eukprot:1187859-Amorphochlora_amoeboformis.AAC.1